MSKEVERVSCDRELTKMSDQEVRFHMQESHAKPALIETIVNLVNKLRKFEEYERNQ